MLKILCFRAGPFSRRDFNGYMIFFYRYPFYDTLGTLGNGEKKKTCFTLVKSWATPVSASNKNILELLEYGKHLFEDSLHITSNLDLNIRVRFSLSIL